MGCINDRSPVIKIPLIEKSRVLKLTMEKLSIYNAFRPHDDIQHTFRQTAQLAKSTIHYPMRHDLKRRFQMSLHKSLNEIKTTDNVFASEKSIKFYHFTQVIFGMITKMPV
jgi:hypothetical protein